jgi:hypothetical protein
MLFHGLFYVVILNAVKNPRISSLSVPRYRSFETDSQFLNRFLEIKAALNQLRKLCIKASTSSRSAPVSGSRARRGWPPQ